MSQNDREYFKKRASTERSLAANAKTPKAAEIHQDLAERYELLIEERRPTLLIFA